MSKARRGDKSFQSGPGKGDADRTSDRDAYGRGYDEIDWGRPQEAPPIDQVAPPPPHNVCHRDDDDDGYGS